MCVSPTIRIYILLDKHSGSFFSYPRQPHHAQRNITQHSSTSPKRFTDISSKKTTTEVSDTSTPTDRPITIYYMPPNSTTAKLLVILDKVGASFRGSRKRLSDLFQEWYMFEPKSPKADVWRGMSYLPYGMETSTEAAEAFEMANFGSVK
ncbi:uncharacterized protein Z519_05434 [Cladophialophora bantiana CBS 173.52]|uniref:Uncharacterized protein n=1 Tax=Cladophialophora bantiana (strain ATCC 10958 / CBS 173.52 / CDC B-1940 / NIH 8579) TaxID=1442370 RepID=A0A0D2HLF4_CLAB1|nr:uncharacterized protein Z519_05434 [Cladophialophora bantiana CBS 173.52]KIW94118.1 hypothetical protein Z519_05434 [Cladophialophora bantiana CBS 173.52]